MNDKKTAYLTLSAFLAGKATGIGFVVITPSGAVKEGGYIIWERGLEATADPARRLIEFIEGLGYHVVVRVKPRIARHLRGLGDRRGHEDTWVSDVDIQVLGEDSDMSEYDTARLIARSKIYGTRQRSEMFLPGDPIDANKAQAIHIAAKAHGYTEDGLRAMLGEYGLYSAKEVTTGIFMAIMKRVNSRVLANIYNKKVEPQDAIAT